MGVVLLSWIIKKETIRAKTISYSSLFLLRVRRLRGARSAVESASEGYSSTTAVPHEYFGLTGICSSEGSYLVQFREQGDLRRGRIEPRRPCRRVSVEYARIC